MSLLNPTPGDVYDRIAVLVRKHRAAIDADRPSEHYADEHDELVRWLEIRFAETGAPPEVLRIYSQLEKVHAKLWDVIERTQKLERTEVGHGSAEREELARLALQAYRLNRGRVRNREEIDKLCGCYAGPEKVTA